MEKEVIHPPGVARGIVPHSLGMVFGDLIFCSGQFGLDPETGKPPTAHTTNPVPIHWITREAAGRLLRDGSLADLAPTILDLLGIEAPDDMTGRSLIVP